MLINIRVGTLINIDGQPHKVVSAGTPLSSKIEYLKLEVEDLSYRGGEVTDIVIFAPVATDGDLGKIRAVLEHEEDED